MKKIKVYKTVQDYLNETGHALEEHELSNNAILGICNEYRDKQRENRQFHFVNVWEDKKWIASTVKTPDKCVVAGRTKDKEDLKLLADYYKDHDIVLNGVFGETFYAEAFAEHFRKKKGTEKKLLAHQLSKINKVTLSEGRFELAIEKDREFLSEFLYQFQEEVNILPKRTKEELFKLSREWIDKENIYMWVDNDEIVSMAAIVRRTRNLVMIGYVYTPKPLRGKGYATSCVEKLSEFILRSGYAYCGLFTEKSNPTSNKIYKQIGYEVLSEFSEIQFV